MPRPAAFSGGMASTLTAIHDNRCHIFYQTGTTTDVDLLSLTLTNGSADHGGAILSYYGTLDISATTIENSTASGEGGEIASARTVITLTKSLVTGNSAGWYGGGIYGRGGLQRRPAAGHLRRRRQYRHHRDGHHPSQPKLPRKRGFPAVRKAWISAFAFQACNSNGPPL